MLQLVNGWLKTNCSIIQQKLMYVGSNHNLAKIDNEFPVYND
jgi:hypothetical protein